MKNSLENNINSEEDFHLRNEDNPVDVKENDNNNNNKNNYDIHFLLPALTIQEAGLNIAKIAAYLTAITGVNCFEKFLCSDWL